MKYTSNEILKLAGVEDPTQVVGKMRVRIGGISIRATDQLINVLDDIVSVTIGNEVAEITLTPREGVSEEVTEALKIKGEKSTADFEARHPERVVKEEVEES